MIIDVRDQSKLCYPRPEFVFKSKLLEGIAVGQRCPATTHHWPSTVVPVPRASMAPNPAYSLHCTMASTCCVAPLSLPHRLGGFPEDLEGQGAPLKFPTLLHGVDLLFSIVRLDFPWGGLHPSKQHYHCTL